jgi:hypothetical protein
MRTYRRSSSADHRSTSIAVGVQTNEPLINTFRLLSAVAVISDEVSNINEALLSADGGWSTA